MEGFDEANREVDRQKDAPLDDISSRLQQQTEREALFTIRWRLDGDTESAEGLKP